MIYGGALKCVPLCFLTEHKVNWRKERWLTYKPDSRVRWYDGRLPPKQKAPPTTRQPVHPHECQLKRRPDNGSDTTHRYGSGLSAPRPSQSWPVCRSTKELTFTSSDSEKHIFSFSRAARQMDSIPPVRTTTCVATFSCSAHHFRDFSKSD